MGGEQVGEGPPAITVYPRSRGARIVTGRERNFYLFIYLV